MLVRFASFELDEPRFELRQGGVAVEVQPKVLDLLIYLVRHRERVVGKDELFDEVWAGVTVTEASLTQAVSVARKVLGDSTEEPRFIRTVRGKGFQFIARIMRTIPPPRASSPRPTATSGSLAIASEPPRHGGEHAITGDLDVPVGEAPHPHLFVLLHGEVPRLGGARWDLGAVDEVTIGRGLARSSSRATVDGKRRLALEIPDSAASRAHARIERAESGGRGAAGQAASGSFQLLDLGARNGTFVNGARIDRALLTDGDVIECGRTCLLFRAALVTPAELRADVDRDARAGADELGSLMPDLQRLRHLLDRIARTELSVALSGEPGTGKQTVARAFHARSGRSGPFVAVRGGAIELGQGARLFHGGGDLPGVLAQARGGTLFVDHVDALPPDAQAALVAALRGLQEAPPAFDSSRVIGATSAPLPALAAAGAVQAELAVRLGGFSLALPPLRERRGDLGLLVSRLLGRVQGGDALTFTGTAVRALCLHTWPGNVSELAACLASAASLAAGQPIAPAHLPPAVAAAVG